MADDHQYIFWINDYRPGTMPFGRLVEYYQQLAKLLGDTTGVHLCDIQEASHGSALRIDATFEASVEERLTAIAAGHAPAEARKAEETINRMLAEDHTSGRLADVRGTKILQFPGTAVKGPEIIEVTDTGTVVGELYYIAAGGGGVHVRIRPREGNVVHCMASRELAKALSAHLLENVRIRGRGQWRRTESAGWVPTYLRIEEFDPVERLNLRAAVTRLRSVNIQWPDDPLGQLAKLNDEPGTA